MVINARITALVLLSLALLSCSTPMPAAETKNNPAPATPKEALVSNKLNNDILYYVNEYRQSRGLKRLELLDVATVQAYMHSRDMATGKAAFGHGGFEQRIHIISQSEGRISASAENVAYGELSAREVVRGWLNSPGHKKNIEGNYALTGIGTYKDRQGVIYFTQIFLRR